MEETLMDKALRALEILLKSSDENIRLNAAQMILDHAINLRLIEAINAGDSWHS